MHRSTYLSLANVPGAYCESYPSTDVWHAITFDVEVNVHSAFEAVYQARSVQPHVWIPGMTEKQVDRFLEDDLPHMYLQSADHLFLAKIRIKRARPDPLSRFWIAEFELSSFQADFLQLKRKYGAPGKREQSAGCMYLDVPSYDNPAVKQLGARWDESMKLWYIAKGVDPSPFKKWLINDCRQD